MRISPALNAAPLYWDGDGAGTVGGGSGTWDTTLARWSTSPTGSTYQAWANANNDDAVFQNSGGTVTLGADVTAGSLTFNNSNYNLSGNTRVVTLGGSAPAISVANALTVIIGNGTTVVLAGTNGWTKDGAGVLQFSAGVNTYTGTVTINGGTVRLASGGGGAGNNHGSVIRGNIEINSGTLLEQVSFSSQIVETSNMTINGGTYTLANGLIEGLNNLTMTAGTVNAATTASGFVLFGAGAGPAAITTNAAGSSATINGRVSIRNGNYTFNVANGAAETDLNFVANIINDAGGAGQLIKDGAGKMVLGGTNTYAANTTVNANGGTLQFAKQVSLYNNNSANWMAAKINVKSGGTLAFNVGGTGEFTTGNVTTLLTNLAASSSATNGMNAGSILGFDTTNASGGSFTIADVLADTTGASGGARGLTKLGTNQLILTNANTYSGTTNVNAGTLLINNGSGSGAGTSNISVEAGAVLGGTGSLTGALNVTGTLSPGASIQSLASGALTMNSGSTFVFEATDNSSTGADLMVVGGGLTLTGVTLDLSGASLAAGTWVLGDKLTLISYTGSGITSGFTGYADDAQYMFGTNIWRFNYNDAGKGDNFASEATGTSFITLTMVPEPSSFAMLLFGAVMMWLVGRKRS